MVSNGLSDAEVIRESLTDNRVFEAICIRHYDAVYKYVARRHGTDRAVDVVQEVFLKALTLRSCYDPSKPECLPWLYAIARNSVGDSIRKARRRAKASRVLREVRVVHSYCIDDIENVAARIDAEILAPQLYAALDVLTPRDREVIGLRIFCQLTDREIAERIGIPLGTAKSRMSRGLRLFIAAYHQMSTRETTENRPEELTG